MDLIVVVVVVVASLILYPTLTGAVAVVDDDLEVYLSNARAQKALAQLLGTPFQFEQLYCV